MYVHVHIGGTYLPIPSRSGKDDVDTLGTCSRTPVDDDSDIGKCDNVFFLRVLARDGEVPSLEVQYSTVR